MKQATLKRRRRKKKPKSKLQQHKDNPHSRYWKGKADTAWAMLIKKRDNYTCQVCGRYGAWIHAHHLIGKGRLFFRHNPENGMTLCAQCHEFSTTLSAHGAPWAFDRWFEKTFPERFEWFEKNRWKEFPGLKINYKEVYEQLLEKAA